MYARTYVSKRLKRKGGFYFYLTSIRIYFNLFRICRIAWQKFDWYLFEKFDRFCKLLLLVCHMGTDRRFCWVHANVHDVTACNVLTVPGISTYEQLALVCMTANVISYNRSSNSRNQRFNRRSDVINTVCACVCVRACEGVYECVCWGV